MSAKEETIQAASFGVLEEAVDFMKKAHELMNQQALDLRQEKEAFESVAKKLDHVHFASTIKLNVRLDFHRLPGPVFDPPRRGDECGLIFPNSGW